MGIAHARRPPAVVGTTSTLIMTDMFSRGLAILMVAGVLTGCQMSKTGSPRSKSPPEPGLARGVRNNCYSLLYDLLKQESHIGLLRFIKREDDDLKKLMRKIADHSSAGAKLLEEFAAQDESISLTDIWLPQGEEATRQAIADLTRKELMDRSGEKFEVTLLLSQNKALGYAAQLAIVGAEHDLQTERSQALKNLGRELDVLRQETFQMLLAKPR